MRISSFFNLFISAFLLVIFLPSPALAYVGPGAGIAAIGAFIAIFVAIIAAIFGFAYYPIKRFLRKRKELKENRQKTSEGNEE